jgi:O-antigen ligase
MTSGHAPGIPATSTIADPGAAAVPANRYIGASDEPSAFVWNVPMAILTLLVINHFARPFEFVFAGYKIPLVICLIGVFAVVMTRALKGFLSAPGKPLIGLMIWMIVCTPFSTWRGGSAMYLLYFGGLQLVLFLLAGSAPRSFRDIKRVGYIVLASSSLYILIGRPSRADERFNLKGTFGNADDVALLAGFLLPFVILIVQRLRNPIAKAFVLLIGCGWLVSVIGLTGTRTGLLAIAALMMLYFFYGNLLQRLTVVALGVLGTLAMLVLLPSTILERFASTFKSFETETVAEELADAKTEAGASVAERRELLHDALVMTARKPIFGVGPGEFPDYRYHFLDPSAPGGHKRFFPSHNTYLQVSSEEGIPGMLCYLGFLGATFFSLRRSLKLNRPGSSLDWELGSQLSICLQAALVYFAVCATFMTCERHPQQYVVAGLAVALERISRHRAAKRSTAALAGPTAPVPLRQQPVPQPLSAAAAVTRPRSALRRRR